MIHDDALPIVWITDQALTKFKALLDAKVEKWRLDWGVRGSFSSEVLVERADCDATVAESPDVQLNDRDDCGNCPVVCLDKREVERWIFGFGNIVTDASLAVAAEAIEEFTRSICIEVGSDENFSQSPYQSRQMVGDFGVVYKLKTPGKQVHVRVAAEAMLKLGLLVRPKPESLIHWVPRQAFADLPVQLQVEIGQADVFIGDLNALGAGDVLLVSNAHAEPVAVLTEDRKVQLRAHIGRVGANRAAQFVSDLKKK
ncbi:hypothetical protein DBR47_03480 [Paucibacter sp. KBW04]|uniref:FliM/FliN family flagellar motor switch protein n=1 Tax=Paucibacter sp. KBW04 TaxID=2153361 RepID=UPI000F55BEEA|nr:FliM/FliN family flagellar motor switch protein [Paucibacter sp. KBW04]RQO63599.1 hypothetical protein DBR47_03480 [Paucibacter sp. KBW04]